MINALYEPFPESVVIHGRSYDILTDFKDWFRFSDMLEDKTLSEKEKLLSLTKWFIFPPKVIDNELVNALCSFYRATDLELDAHQEDEGSDEHTFRPPVLNWKIDAKYIIGDFMRFYGIDLLSTEMHWWRFRTLLAALPDDSQMMKRIAYRGADLGQIKNEAERKRVMRMQQLFALPYELDDEDIGAVFGGSM